MSRDVFIVDGARTPFLKARTGPGPFTAADMATAAGTALLMRQSFAPDQLDEVILGCASPAADEVNIGRVVALRMGCGNAVPGWTVMRNCASGMQALDSAIANIQCGRSGLVLAGGVDALSHAPLLFSEKMVRWLANWYATKTVGQKLVALKSLRLAYLAPVIGIMKGLTDPIVGQLMGQTAENLAFKFGITREDMDAFAVQSHQRVVAAQDAGHYADEIVPLIGRDGTVYGADDGVRRDSSMADHRRGGVAAAGVGRGGRASWTAADRTHRRQPVGRPRAGPDGAWPGACSDADSAAPRVGAERCRCLGAERSLRGTSDRLLARVR